MAHESRTARLSGRQKKASVLFLMVLTLAFANETFDWPLVGTYDWEAIIALTLFGLGGLTGALVSSRRPESGAASHG